MILTGDCCEVMPTLEAESVDAVVTDPPYGLEFMGKEWDRLGGNRTSKPGIGDRDTPWVSNVGWNGVRCRTCGHLPHGGSPCRCEKPDLRAADDRMRRMGEWHERWATEAFRLAKPSAYLLAFGGTRTVHRMTCAIEDAGWIVRDMLCWGFASGFPKSKASLKPAYEPIIRAQKPLSVPVEWSHVHHALAALVWLSEPERPGAGCVSARVARLFDDSGPTGTSRSPEAGSTSWSIASSWASILAAVSRAGSRSTTSTETRLTTALRTLSWSLSPVISASTMPPCECLAGGSSPTAPNAASGSSDGWDRPLAILRRSALASAIGPIAQSVAGLCASVAADLSDGLEAEPTAPAPATTSHAGRADFRPIVMARKPGPLRELAIDACRIGVKGADGVPASVSRTAGVALSGSADGTLRRQTGDEPGFDPTLGRWPANLVLTDPIFDGGWDGVVGGGETASGDPSGSMRNDLGWFGNGSQPVPLSGYGDSGTYSRFFLIPKADRAEREPIWASLPERVISVWGGDEDDLTPGKKSTKPRANVHPTVKPLELMRHLVRLVTPTDGMILDPFLGSGTTAIAAEMEGFRWIGIEREPEYVRIAEARLHGTQKGLGLPA